MIDKEFDIKYKDAKKFVQNFKKTKMQLDYLKRYCDLSTMWIELIIDKGMPIEQVQKLLGHEKIDTTLHYAMVKQSNVVDCHNEKGKFYQENKAKKKKNDIENFILTK